jgi:hypothetical protein
MPALLLLLTGITLFLIAWQDFGSRAVSWFLFPLLAICGLGLAFIELRSLGLALQYVIFNDGFLLLQFVVLKAWLVLRRKGRSALIDHAIGKGDIFFLLAAGCFFSPFNFILFYLLSLLFALVIYLAVRSWPIFAARSSTVPLAGLQAGFLLICLPLHLLFKQPLTNDNWMILKLT